VVTRNDSVDLCRLLVVIPADDATGVMHLQLRIGQGVSHVELPQRRTDRSNNYSHGLLWEKVTVAAYDVREKIACA
jgi:hypothetical protein